MLSEAMCVQKSGVVIAENTKLMHSLYWLKIWLHAIFQYSKTVFLGVLGIRLGSLESEKIIKGNIWTDTAIDIMKLK